MSNQENENLKHYHPGEPRTFGNPPDTSDLTTADVSKLSERYSNPESYMRLAHGQDPTFNRVFDLMRRDWALSAFPDAKEGVEFLNRYLPLFIQECKGFQLSF